MKKPTFAFTLNGKETTAHPGETYLDVIRRDKVDLPVMCYFEGLTVVGACRLCLLEIEGQKKLIPACAAPAQEGAVVRTDTEQLKKYRRITVELFFAERNHYCAVCVANNNCELQNLAREVGMDHVRFPFLSPEVALDASHPYFIMDQNRCILCTRCVRVCDEVEGAHTWDVSGRGHQARIISDFNTPWGQSETCTSCSKCVQICPTGALWPKQASTGHLEKKPQRVTDLIHKREGPL